MAKKENKTPAEELWHKDLRATGDYAVMYDSQGEAILYNFDRRRRHWAVTKDLTIKTNVWRFLKKHPGYATNTNTKNCSAITHLEVADCGKVLSKSDGVLISTKNHFLDIQPSGRVRLIHKDDLQFQGKEYFTPIYIDVDLSTRVKPGQAWYTPKKNEEIEDLSKGGLLAQLIHSGFPLEENRRCFQEFFGDTLNPTLRKAFPILIGPPDGGKSQFLELLLCIQTNSFGGNLSALQGFDLESYIGKSLIAFDEFEETVNDQAFKRLVGGAQINIARKFLPSISIKPDFKMFGCCNKLPNFSDKSGAIDVRIYPIWVEGNKGPVVFEIAKRIWKEQPIDLLDWAINGAVSVILRGRILKHDEMPEASKAVSNQLKEKINPALVWIEDVGMEMTEGEEYISKDELYQKFIEWAIREGRQFLKNISKANFFKDNFYPAMQSLMPDYDQSLEKKLSFNYGRESKRQIACPLRLTNEVGVNQKVIINDPLISNVTPIKKEIEQPKEKTVVKFHELEYDDNKEWEEALGKAFGEDQ